MQTLEARRAARKLDRARRAMQITRFATLSLITIGVIAGCSEPTPTAAARTTAANSAAMSMDHGPLAGGFTVEVLSRSSFPDNINATFRIKLAGDKEEPKRKNGKREPRPDAQVIHVENPSDVVVAKVTIQPGGSLGWHTHPGPAIASVASGVLTIINARDCKTRRYAAQQAFVDPGQGNVHIGFNDSDVETVVYVTFLDVPTGQSPTIVAEEADC